MGKERETTVVQSSGTTTPEPTAAEKEMQKLQLEQYRKTVGPQTDVQLGFLDLAKQLASGTSPLPGFYGEMAQGISPEAIGTQASQLAGQYMPGFQQLGLADSGVAYEQTARGIANELLYPAEQFNIGVLQNLLNLALSGQAQVQAPVTAGMNTLASSLAGLRSTSYNTAQDITQTSMNPFMKSFQTSLGSTFGSPAFGWGPFDFGG